MKTLKTIKLAIIVIVVILVTHSCYKDSEDRHYRIPFKNNTQRTLYVDISIHWDWYSQIDYLDTLLSWTTDPSRHPEETMVKPYGEDPDACFRRSFYESSFNHHGFDTLIVFVFDADTLEALGWDSVCSNYKVLQRYDLSLEDLQALDFKLCFPPSESIKRIHMWPPYGTYDEEGNVIRRRNR